MKYVSIDIETGGLDARYSLLEFAAVVEDTADQLPLEELPTFHCYFELDDPVKVCPFTADMHQRIWTLLKDPRERIEADDEWMEFTVPKVKDGGLVFNSFELFTFSFVSWLQHLELLDKPIKRKRINVAGKNVAWDMSFLDEISLREVTQRHVKPFTQRSGMRHRTLDPSILYWVEGDDAIPGLEKCMKRAGLELTDYHSAVGDALDVIRLLRASDKF
jgi:hypothetical protein